MSEATKFRDELHAIVDTALNTEGDLEVIYELAVAFSCVALPRSAAVPANSVLADGVAWRVANAAIQAVGAEIQAVNAEYAARN